jgi:hypothetical protein
MSLNSDGSLLACQGADKLIELYHVRNEEEVRRKLKRRAKRLKEKAKGHHGLCHMCTCHLYYCTARHRRFLAGRVYVYWSLIAFIDLFR